MANLETLVPDYLADFAILICPSTLRNGTPVEQWDTRPNNSPVGMRDYREMSPDGNLLTGDGIVYPCEVTGAVPYSYIGWAVPESLSDVMPLDPLMQSISALAMTWQSSSAMARKVADSDWDFAMPVGGHTRAFRLREGVERFFITDINVPASGATAQSQLAVMWDALASGPSMFNHVPGGCNALFLDGHVEYLRWSGGTGRFPVDSAGMLFHKANHMLNGTSMGNM